MNHRTMGAREAAPHFEAAIAAWMFARASEEYLAMPEQEQDPLAARLFRSLEFNVEQLQDVLHNTEGGPIIDRAELESACTAWARSMPLPKGPVPRSLAADEDVDD